MPCMECPICLPLPAPQLGSSSNPQGKVAPKQDPAHPAPPPPVLSAPFLPPLLPEPQNQLGKLDLGKNNGEHKCEPPANSPSALREEVGGPRKPRGPGETKARKPA